MPYTVFMPVPTEAIASSAPPEALNKLPPSPQERGGENVLERNVWVELNDFLGEHQLFAPDSRATQYVQQRLDVLSDGRKAEVVVVHDKQANGFALPGYVVVTDGLLKLLEYQEELDAFLAHEWTHVNEEHAKHRTGEQEKGITPAQLAGIRRRHETEADFLPVELLDKKGINPFGISSLLKKLGRNIADAPADQRLSRQELDFEHGSTIDRRLNLEDAAWLVDIRYLSQDLTPIAIASNDLEDYQKDTDLYQTYDQLDSISKRRFLHRQFQILTRPDNNQTPEEIQQKLQQITAWQVELIKENNADITEDDLENTLVLTLFAGFDVPLRTSTKYDSKEIQLKTWIEQFDNQDKILTFFSSLKQTYWDDLGIKVDHERVTTIGKQILSSYLTKRGPGIDFVGYKNLVQQIQESHLSDELFYIPIIDYMHRQGLFNQESEIILARYLADLLIDEQDFRDQISELSLLPLSQQLEDNNQNLLAAYDRGTPEFEAESQRVFGIGERIGKYIHSIRIEKLRGLQQDPVAFFTHLAKYNYQPSLDDYYGNEPEARLIEQMIKRYPPDKVIEILKGSAENNKSAISSREFAPALAEAYLGKDSVVIKEASLSERFLLWAVCLNKEGFINYIQKDLARIDLEKADIESIKSIVNNALAAPEHARKLGFEINWDFTKEDLRGFDELLKRARDVFLEWAREEAGNPRAMLELLDMLPIFNLPMDEQQEQQWARVTKDVLDDQDQDPEKLLKLFTLACLTDNTQVLLQIPPKSMEAIVRSLPFEQGMNLIFSRFTHLPHHIFRQSLDYLIEEKAKTLDDFTQLEKSVEGEIEGLLGDNKAVGEAALADAFLVDPSRTYEGTRREVGNRTTDVVYGMEPPRLLRSLLETRVSDEGLKRYVFDRWWAKNRLYYQSPDLRKYFGIEDITIYRNRQAQFVHWVNEAPPKDIKEYKPMARVIQDLYLSDRLMKYAALRKILVGPGSVLETGHGREALQEAFLSRWVDFQGSEQGERTTKELISSALSVGEEDELYQRLTPILIDMILLPPQKPWHLANLADELSTARLEEMSRRGILSRPTEVDQKAITKKVYTLMTGGEKRDQRTVGDIDPEEVDENEVIDRLLATFPESNGNSIEKPFSPWELAIAAGEKSGAVGVRMLQLAGQYFEVPSDLRERLMDVYDSQRGQSRLQAYRVIKREAESFQAMQQVVDGIAEIHPRIGGGSLMTVYDARFRDGSRKALAVRNPNVEYHVGKTVDLLRRTVDYAIARNPQDRNYQLLKVLLDDVEQWVSDELHDPTFEEKDQRFRMQNDGRFNQFNRGSSRYQLLVPDVVPTQTRWIRLEDFVEGKNFTSLQVSDGPSDIPSGVINKEDYKQAISLLVSNYVYQIVSTGLVHSDVHPGNFRITADNSQVAVFDRYNLLELTKQEKDLVKGLVIAFNTGGAEGIRGQFVDYALSLPENQGHADFKEDILNHMREASVGVDVERSIVDSVLLLKQRGIKVPLKISLIGKNLQSLNRMSQDAGFGNLMEAYLHTQSRANLLKLFMFS